MKPNVVIIKNNLVDDIRRFEKSDEAEKYFLERCAWLISNWDEYTQEDKENILEDGYEEFEDGSICLAWS